MNILLNVPSGNGRVRSQMVKVILYCQTKYNTLCSKTTMYCLLEKHAKGINIFGECKGKGQLQICSEDDVEEIVESWELEVGNTYNRTDAELLLKKKQAANLEKAGFTNIINRNISINTVNNMPPCWLMKLPLPYPNLTSPSQTLGMLLRILFEVLLPLLEL